MTNHYQFHSVSPQITLLLSCVIALSNRHCFFALCSTEKRINFTKHLAAWNPFFPLINDTQCTAKSKKEIKKASPLLQKARIAGTENLNNSDVTFLCNKNKDMTFTPTERNFFVCAVALTNSIRTDIVGRL